jgi:hypothetical protein
MGAQHRYEGESRENPPAHIRLGASIAVRISA